MSTGIVWFRQDLRLADNPALTAARKRHQQLLMLYIHAPEEAADWAPGSASRWWLHHSLYALGEDLRKAGAELLIRTGNSLEVLQQLRQESGATAVYWNRLYEPWSINRDRIIKSQLQADGIEVHSHNAALLLEPWENLNQQRRPFRVFTPFWKSALAKGIDQPLQPKPRTLPSLDKKIEGLKLEQLKLLPKIRWDGGFSLHWTPGEAGAQQTLERFCAQTLPGYQRQRDYPGETGTSRLSPHLHFGEISPRQIVRALLGSDKPDSKDAQHFLAEIGWREFAYHLLYHFPHTTDQPLNEKFAAFPWAKNTGDLLRAWQRGQTGIPLVDAGMRELWRTGWMHNRIRMVVASFLSKNCLISWQQGAKWFWDTLVDADLASNTLGWQWTAGCGADAAPYFRVFNPARQAERFDPQGVYTRKWVPEIARLPDKFLQTPWLAPPDVLEQCGIVLGQQYPLPIVDLSDSRNRALAHYQKIK
jgi:deoxyribodipyrimidine photo-lyase